MHNCEKTAGRSSCQCKTQGYCSGHIHCRESDCSRAPEEFGADHTPLNEGARALP